MINGYVVLNDVFSSLIFQFYLTKESNTVEIEGSYKYSKELLNVSKPIIVTHKDITPVGSAVMFGISSGIVEVHNAEVYDSVAFSFTLGADTIVLVSHSNDRVTVKSEL